MTTPRERIIHAGDRGFKTAPIGEDWPPCAYLAAACEALRIAREEMRSELVPYSNYLAAVQVLDTLLESLRVGIARGPEDQP